MNDTVVWAHESVVTFLSQMHVWLWGTETRDGHALALVGIGVSSVIAYYVVGAILSRLVKRIVRSARHREWHKKDIEKRQKTLAALFVSVWRILIILVASYAVFKEFVPNANDLLAPLFASAGIIGVALGFGAQSVIKDFLSGIFIISENQYRVGDIVDIEGFSGTVERIGSRSTVLRDVDGNVHYFPNGMVMHVINKTMGYSMARFIVAIHPSSDIDKVIKLVNDIGDKLAKEEKWKSKIIEAPAFVSLGEITGTSVEIIIAGKTQPSDQWSVIAEMRRRLLHALEQNGIELGIAPNIAMGTQKK